MINYYKTNKHRIWKIDEINRHILSYYKKNFIILNILKNIKKNYNQYTSQFVTTLNFRRTT